jgi:hypothetical protein
MRIITTREYCKIGYKEAVKMHLDKIENWTPLLIYIHVSRIIIGLVFGLFFGIAIGFLIGIKINFYKEYMMEVKMNDPTNHKVYGYVTEEYFYKALQRAKVENLYTDANGRTDINKLIQLMWETFSNGSYIILPNHECRAKVCEYITKITSCKNGIISESILSDKKIEAVADMIIEAKPKARKSRAKLKVELPVRDELLSLDNVKE